MPSQASARASDRTVATNRRARHDYEVLETVEAGLVLRGTEVKSLRAGQVTFKDSYATMRNEEAWLVGCRSATCEISCASTPASSPSSCTDASRPRFT